MESEPNLPKNERILKPRPYVNTASTNFNILSNKLHSKHHYLPTNRRSKATKYEGTREFSPAGMKIMPQGEKRDFHILSNRYFQQHDEKIRTNN